MDGVLLKRVVLSQFGSQSLSLAIGHFVHQLPKLVRVVVVHGVAQFVKDDIVAQMLRHLHEIEREVDAVLC